MGNALDTLANIDGYGNYREQEVEENSVEDNFGEDNSVEETSVSDSHIKLEPKVLDDTDSDRPELMEISPDLEKGSLTSAPVSTKQCTQCVSSTHFVRDSNENEDINEDYLSATDSSGSEDDDASGYDKSNHLTNNHLTDSQLLEYNREKNMLITYITLNDAPMTMAIWNRQKVIFRQEEITEVLEHASENNFMDVFRALMQYTDIPMSGAMLSNPDMLDSIPEHKVRNYFNKLQTTIDTRIIAPRVTSEEERDLILLYEYCVKNKNDDFLYELVMYLKMYGVDEIINDVELMLPFEAEWFCPSVVHVLAYSLPRIRICQLNPAQLSEYKMYLLLKYHDDLPDLTRSIYRIDDVVKNA